MHDAGSMFYSEAIFAARLEIMVADSSGCCPSVWSPCYI